MQTKLHQHCCWKPSRKLPALYMRLGNRGISFSKEVPSIIANMHWSNLAVPEWDVTAYNQVIMNLSIEVNQLPCTQPILMSMCATTMTNCWSAGLNKSRSEVQLRKVCWRDEPGESRSEDQVREDYWKAEPCISMSKAQACEDCWRTELGRSRSEVKVRDFYWNAEPCISISEARENCWKAKPGRPTSEVQGRKVCWRAEPCRLTSEAHGREDC